MEEPVITPGPVNRPLLEDLNDDQRDLLSRWPIGAAFELPRHSTCVVAGAYTGRVMQLLDTLYQPQFILGFEPQMWAFRRLSIMALEHPSWRIWPYGIGTETAVDQPMGEYHTDACSFVNAGSREVGTGDLVEIGTAMRAHGHVDLAVFNMEGYEFDLLPHMITAGLMHRYDQFAIQWHTGFGNDGAKDALFDAMAETHDLVMDFYPRWTWHRKRGMVTPSQDMVAMLAEWRHTLGVI